MAHAEDAEDAENDFAHAEARSARRFIHIAVLAARERNKITESICMCRTYTWFSHPGWCIHQ